MLQPMHVVIDGPMVGGPFVPGAQQPGIEAQLQQAVAGKLPLQAPQMPPQQYPPWMQQQPPVMQMPQMQPCVANMYVNPWFWPVDPSGVPAPGVAPPGWSQVVAPAIYPSLLTAQSASAMAAHNAAGASQMGNRGAALANSCQGGKQQKGKAKSNKRDDPVEAGGSCSATLREVRREGAKCDLSLRDILVHASELARDAQGSQLLQARLEAASPMSRSALCEAMLPDVVQLASDVAGCQVVQRMLEIGNTEQRRAVVGQLQGEALKLSNRMYGCRVIQKAIEVSPPELQMQIAGELEKGIIDCIKSMHGNYVVQKCIEQMPPDSVTFIAQAIEGRVEVMASHIYGCRVIQRLLEHSAPQRLENMLQHILRSTLRLAQDPYGNYVIRHILEHGKKEHKRHIIETVRDNLVELGRDKCGSNVVEKCIEAASVGEHVHYLQDERLALVKAMLGESGDANPPCQQLVDDRFGKYVVQCALQYGQGDEREQLRERLMAAAPRLRKGSVGTGAMPAHGREPGMRR